MWDQFHVFDSELSHKHFSVFPAKFGGDGNTISAGGSEVGSDVAMSVLG